MGWFKSFLLFLRGTVFVVAVLIALACFVGVFIVRVSLPDLTEMRLLFDYWHLHVIGLVSFLVAVIAYGDN